MPEYVSYEEFGRRFFEIAVTEERIGDAFAMVAGEEFMVGPLASGPGGVAKVEALVKIAEPDITRHIGEIVSFTVRLPLFIGLLIDLKVDRIRYDVDGLITLPLTVRAVAPLQIHIDVEPPAPRDVFVDVASHNLRGSIVRNLAQVDDEIRRVIAKFVADEIEKPEVRKARHIDVAEELNRALAKAGDAIEQATAEEAEEILESFDVRGVIAASEVVGHAVGPGDADDAPDRR